MVDIAGLRTEIATAVNAVDGLRDMQSEGLAPDRLNLPTCTLRPDDYSSPMTLTLDTTNEHFELALIHSKRGGSVRAQRSLDELYSDVVAALRGCPSLLTYERRAYGDLEVQGVPVLGAILRLEMLSQ